MVYTKFYEKPEYNIKEILRYMGCRKADEAVNKLIAECVAELKGKLAFKVCYTELPISHKDGLTDLTFMQTKSAGLKKNLGGCDKIVLFAATVGLEIDRLIARYGVVSPVKSVAFQAIGAERIESLCDLFEADVKAKAAEEGRYIRPRFSAGYGDFELSAQKKIFEVLDCQRKIGLALNDSMLMSPSKSVTAIIGISKSPRVNRTARCAACGKKDCEYKNCEYEGE